LAIKTSREMSEKEIVDLARDSTHQIFQMTVLAFHKLRFDKAEMVEKIEADPELWGDFVKSIYAAIEQTRCILSFLRTAEARIMVAGSTCEMNWTSLAR
jgi:hypothetical protein